ncbi:MAG TPA: PKD domain-containing protein, partial [Bacteroidia bacterium]|nr:PKD domain-containing protein [Bacteroidia bacterium]
MFDIVPAKDIAIDSLSLYLTTAYTTTGDYTFRVYYKSGTFVGSQLNAGVWTNGGDYKATFDATGFLKFDIEDIDMSKGETYGFYITIVSGPGIAMDYTTLGSFTSYSNSDVTIIAGNGVSGLFGGTFSPRGFNGMIHYRGQLCFSNRTPVNAVISSVPRGVTYQPKSGSKGFFNAGTLTNPDFNAAPDRIDFQIVPPTGFLNSGYGASGTWNITNVEVKTSTGTTVPASMYSLVNPTGSSNGEFRLNPDTTFNDQTICVNLTVKRNDNGCDTVITRCIYIAPRPKVSFTHTSTCLGDVTTFNTTSTVQVGTITHEWDFGVPGATSVFGLADYQFPAPGNYNVKLIVTSDKGFKDSVIQVITVKQVPVANFDFNNACEGTPVSLVDNSTLPPGAATHEWDFESDGIIDATGTTTNKLYSIPNVYRVTYRVTVDGCTDVQEGNVTQAPRAVPDFTHTALQCDNAGVTFTNNSTPPAFGNVGYTWKFGDNKSAASMDATHTYNAFQTYTVTLLASTNLGCRDSIQKNITLRESPIAGFTVVGSACHGDVLNFTDNSTVPAASNTYSWDFGDNNSSSSQNAAYQYSSPGVKTITLTVISSNGCESEKDTTITIDAKPQAGFTASEVCLGKPTVFTNLSYSADVLSYSWELDDNFTSALSSPVVTYTTDGPKDVTLIATSANGCTDTANVVAMVNPQPQAQILIASQLSRDGAFGFSTNTPGSKFVWLFGDGGRDSVANTVYKYQADGLYEVILIVVSDKGCMDVDTQTLSVNRLGVDNSSALEGNVKMYPNPGAGTFNITFSGIEAADVKSIVVTNSLGQVVAEPDVRNIANNVIAVNIAEQAAGIYFINVETISGKAAFKYNLVK